MRPSAKLGFFKFDSNKRAFVSVFFAEDPADVTILQIKLSYFISYGKITKFAFY